jgi:hypothetical protein
MATVGVLVVGRELKQRVMFSFSRYSERGGDETKTKKFETKTLWAERCVASGNGGEK